MLAYKKRNKGFKTSKYKSAGESDTTIKPLIKILALYLRLVHASVHTGVVAMDLDKHEPGQNMKD